MAEQNSSSTLHDDVSSVINLSFPIEAILAGALSLLENSESSNAEDRREELFNAQQLVEIALDKVRQIYSDADDLNIRARVKALESAEVSHV